MFVMAFLVSGAVCRRAWSLSCAPRLQRQVEGLRKVRVTVDPGLRARLRLASKHRKTRVFVDEAADEGRLREAIHAAVPPLRHVDYDLDVVEGEEAKPLRVRVVATESDVARRDAREARGDGSTALSMSTTTTGPPYQMVSFYAFFDRPLLDDLEKTASEEHQDEEEEEEEEGRCATVSSTVAALAGSWEPLGVVGRAYVASEGVNAQLAVPRSSLAAFAEAHERVFGRLGEDGVRVAQPRCEEGKRAPFLNLDVVVGEDEWRSRKAFRTLHVRRRSSVVVDSDDKAAGPMKDLDLSDPGREASPAEWHAALGGDYDATDKTKKKPSPVVLDVRNHYESAIGTFAGATPLLTETFKDTYASLDAVLRDVPRDEPVHMFCTGGIRCVKAGAYVKQKLGFRNVSRLQGGVVNYARHLRDTATTREHDDDDQFLDRVSQFRGVNYVFNERMGEPITTTTTKATTTTTTGGGKKKEVLLDARAAEALALAAERQGNLRRDPAEASLYDYAERASGAEPKLLWRVRLDAAARYPEGAARMLCGPTQGRLLALLAQIAGATRALELGTFCGYGSLWLASALGAEGRVVTVDRDRTANAIAKAHFDEARVLEPSWAPIDLVEADTAAFLDEDNLKKYDPFDVAYLDADKKGYARALDALLDAGLLRKGALVVADNTLWKGRVLGVEHAGAALSEEDEAELQANARDDARRRALALGHDADAAEKDAARHAKAQRRDRHLQQAMHEFNLKLRRDPRLDQVVLPLRDGLTIARVVADL